MSRDCPFKKLEVSVVVETKWVSSDITNKGVFASNNKFVIASPKGAIADIIPVNNID